MDPWVMAFVGSGAACFWLGRVWGRAGARAEGYAEGVRMGHASGRTYGYLEGRRAGQNAAEAVRCRPEWIALYDREPWG